MKTRNLDTIFKSMSLKEEGKVRNRGQCMCPTNCTSKKDFDGSAKEERMVRLAYCK